MTALHSRLCVEAVKSSISCSAEKMIHTQRALRSAARAFVIGFLLASCTSAAETERRFEGIVSSATPEATAAGVHILERGGNVSRGRASQYIVGDRLRRSRILVPAQSRLQCDCHQTTKVFAAVAALTREPHLPVCQSS